MKACKDCNYFRPYCSNSRSSRYNSEVSPTDLCSFFVLRGEKAPLSMRVANAALARVLGYVRRDAEKGARRDA